MEARDGQSLDELVEAFEEHLRRTRGTHPSVSRKDVYYVRLFLKYVGDEDVVDVTGFSASDVISFIESLVGRYQPTTIKGVSTALRLMCSCA